MPSKSMDIFRKAMRDEAFITSIHSLMKNEIPIEVLNKISVQEQVKLMDFSLVAEDKKHVLPGTFHAEFVLSELLPILKAELRDSVKRIMERDMDFTKNLDMLNELNTRIEEIEGIIRKKVGALRLVIDKEVAGITNRVLGELSGFSKEFQGDDMDDFQFPNLDPRVITTSIERTRSLLSVSMKELDDMLATFLKETLDMFIADWERFTQEINKSLEEDFSSIDKLLRDSRSEIYQQVQKIGRASVADDAIFEYDLENILGKLQNLVSNLKESQIGQLEEALSQITREFEKANQVFFLALRSNIDNLETQVKNSVFSEFGSIEENVKDLISFAINGTTSFFEEIDERITQVRNDIDVFQEKFDDTLESLNESLVTGIQKATSNLSEVINDLMSLQERVDETLEEYQKFYDSSKNALLLRFSAFEDSIKDSWMRENEKLSEQKQILQRDIDAFSEKNKHAVKEIQVQQQVLFGNYNEFEGNSEKLREHLKQQKMLVHEQEELIKELENVINNPGSRDIKGLQRRLRDIVKVQKSHVEESMDLVEDHEKVIKRSRQAFEMFYEKIKEKEELQESFLTNMRERISKQHLDSTVLEYLNARHQENQKAILELFDESFSEHGLVKAFILDAKDVIEKVLRVDQKVFEELETHKAVNTSFIRHNMKSFSEQFHADLIKEFKSCHERLIQTKNDMQQALTAKQKELENKQNDYKFTITSKLAEISSMTRNKILGALEKSFEKAQVNTKEVKKDIQKNYVSLLEPVESSINEVQTSMKDVFAHFSKSRQEFLDQTLATLDSALLKSANVNKNRGKESIQRVSEKYSNKINALNNTKNEVLESTHKSLSQVNNALLSQLNQLEQEIGDQVVALAESIEKFQKMKPTLMLNLLHEVHSKIDDITHNLLVRLLKWVNTFENETINDLGLTQLTNYTYKLKKDLFEGYSVPEKNVEIAVRESLVTLNELVTEYGLINARLVEE